MLPGNICFGDFQLCRIVLKFCFKFNDLHIIALVRSIQFKNILAKHITLRCFNFLHIILTKRKVTCKYALSVFSGNSLLYKGILCHNNLTICIYNVLCRIQTEYCPFKLISGFSICLNDSYLHFLSLVGNIHACIDNLSVLIHIG